MSERIPDSVRRIVATRANNICEYCRCLESFSTQSFTVDHIKPRKVGGETTLENLAWSCFGCNAYKHTKTEGIVQKLTKIFPFLILANNLGMIILNGLKMRRKLSEKLPAVGQLF